MSASSTNKPPSLGQRLARLQDPTLGYSAEDLRTMPFNQLSMMKVGFGKTKKGQTFLEATEGDAAWSKWVAEHMAEIAKPEHRAYLIFLERYVEMGEAADAALAEPSHTKKVPKSRPMPKARLPVTSGHMSEPEASFRATAGRGADAMEQMEVAIQQMLGAIQRMASKPQ